MTGPEVGRDGWDVLVGGMTPYEFLDRPPKTVAVTLAYEDGSTAVVAVLNAASAELTQSWDKDRGSPHSRYQLVLDCWMDERIGSTYEWHLTPAKPELLPEPAPIEGRPPGLKGAR